jgi:hypothetical protein
MFNRYWRTYPWILQLSLLMLLVLTLSSFATYLVLALGPRLSGLTMNDFVKLSPLSTVKAIRVGLIAQAVSQLGTFVVYQPFSLPFLPTRG